MTNILNAHQFDANVELPTFNSAPLVSGVIRTFSSDFQVNEALSFEPSGEGEHLFLLIEKQDCNTDWVATQLRRLYQLRTQDIGYAGKKDRYSLSRQWFSLHLPGKDADLSLIDFEDFRVVESTRHNKKLRKGAIAFNRFKLHVRDLSGKVDDCVLDKIKTLGVPNYFGYQRFGRNGDNLNKAQQLFDGKLKVRSRNKRGLYFSAARSFVFNLQVANRLEQSCWHKPLPGDCLMLQASQSYFVDDGQDKTVTSRVENGELHVSGWLMGRQLSTAEEHALELERQVTSQFAGWLQALKSAKMDSARRAMRVIPQNFNVTSPDKDELLVEFSLPTGCFATSVLREFLIVKDARIETTEQENQRND